MKRNAVAVVALILLASCGQRAPADQAAEVTPAAAPAPENSVADALRPQANAYYADFVRAPGMERFAIDRLGLGAEAAARLTRNMDVQTPGALIAANGVEALVFFGCMAHNCANAAGVLAIDTATGDVFAGVRDEAGEVILKPNARLQMLLTQTSPTQSWADPRRGS